MKSTQNSNKTSKKRNVNFIGLMITTFFAGIYTGFAVGFPSIEFFMLGMFFISIYWFSVHMGLELR